MKLLAVLFEIVERLNQNNADKDLSVVYSLLQYNELNPNTVASATNKQIYLWLWQSMFDEISEVSDILKQYPLFFRDIETLNVLSKRMNVQNFHKLDNDMQDKKTIQLFFDILSINFNRLGKTKVSDKNPGFELILKSDSSFLNSNKSVLIEFLDRVSCSNSKESKSFLVAFMKSLGQVYQGKIENLLLEEMAHLYRDNFSFQSILLMNALILSDFPHILDHLSDNSPLFIVSTLIKK